MNIIINNILLIIFPFYEYHTHVIKNLENLGYHVDILLNQFGTTYAFSQNKIFFLLNCFLKRIKRENLSEYIVKKYDIVLAIGGYTFSKKFIDALRNVNPYLRSIVFFWDSFKYWDNSYVIDWFDEKYSFDIIDCKKHQNNGLRHLPNFYLGNEFIDQFENHMKFDLTFIGSLHVFSITRLFVVRRIISIAKKNELKYFIYLYCDHLNIRLKDLLCCFTSIRDLLYWFFLSFFKRKEFIFDNKLPLSKVREIESNTDCIIDIPIKKQTGTTIRVLEALAAGKKVITTNPYIKIEKFYNPKNILILNKKIRNKEIIDFLNIESMLIDISYLKIENWLSTLLDQSC